MSSGTYVAEVNVTRQEDGRSEADDLVLKALDVVTAELADPIHVSGEVTRVGPLQVGDHRELTVIQALSLSGGLTRDAAAKVVIYRPISDSKKKQEITVDLSRVLKGREADQVLYAKDIVYVPRATGKAVAIRTLATMIGIATPHI